MSLLARFKLMASRWMGGAVPQPAQLDEEPVGPSSDPLLEAQMPPAPSPEPGAALADGSLHSQGSRPSATKRLGPSEGRPESVTRPFHPLPQNQLATARQPQANGHDGEISRRLGEIGRHCDTLASAQAIDSICSIAGRRDRDFKLALGGFEPDALISVHAQLSLAAAAGQSPGATTAAVEDILRRHGLYSVR
jgi:hypothetical protein